MAGLKSLAKDTANIWIEWYNRPFLRIIACTLYTIKLSAASGGYGGCYEHICHDSPSLVVLTYGMETRLLPGLPIKKMKIRSKSIRVRSLQLEVPLFYSFSFV